MLYWIKLDLSFQIETLKETIVYTIINPMHLLHEPHVIITVRHTLTAYYTISNAPISTKSENDIISFEHDTCALHSSAPWVTLYNNMSRERFKFLFRTS